MIARPLILLLLMGMQVHAAPTGADLLRACRDSIDHGARGIKGAMCEYYVTPCACEINVDNTTPRFCPPERATTDTLATLVVKGLRRSPELQRKEARVAAAVILADKFPCNK